MSGVGRGSRCPTNRLFCRLAVFSFLQAVANPVNAVRVFPAIRPYLPSWIYSVAVDRPASSLAQPQGMCLDKGYDFAEVRRNLDEFGFTAHIRSRGEEAQAIKREAGFKARRWVVERTHSWLNRFRRILVRWDKFPENYIAFLHFACALITLRAAGLLG